MLPTLGVDPWPAWPTADTRAGKVPFSPTPTLITLRPSLRSSRSPPPSLMLRSGRMSGRCSSSQRMPTPAVPSSSSATARNHRSPFGFQPSRARVAIATARAATSSFMSIAPRPYEPAVIVDDGLERRVRPVPDVHRHHVGVTDEGEALRICVGTGDPRDEVGAVFLPGHELALDPGALEVVLQVLGHQRLVARVPGRGVRRVQPDQVLGQLDDFAMHCVHVVGRYRPRWSTCTSVVELHPRWSSLSRPRPSVVEMTTTVSGWSTSLA